MKRILYGAAAFLCLTCAAAGAAQGADITELIPATSPFLVVINDPEAAGTRLKGYAGPSEEGGETQGPGADAIFAMLGLQGVPEGIDLHGPMAAAMPQFPFPLVAVSVSDYSLFLGGLGAGAPPDAGPQAPSLPPGMEMDSVVVGGKPLFSRKVGSFALLSPMPTALTPPAADYSLAALLSEEEKNLLAKSDLYLRLDVGLILTIVEPMVQPYLSTLGETTPAPPENKEGNGENPAEFRRLLMSQGTLLLRGLRQVSSLSLAGTVGDEGISLSSLTYPLSGSPFEKMLGRLEPTGHDLLRFFTPDVFMAGALSADFSALSEMFTAIIDLTFDSGLYALAEDDRAQWDRLLEEFMALTGTHSAYSFGPSKTGEGFSANYIGEVKDGARARQLFEDSVALTEKMMASAPGGMGGTMVLEAGADDHGGVPIDHMRFSLDAPVSGEEREEYDRTMDTLFGGSELHFWYAFVGDRMLASYYTPTPDELKGLIDSMKNGKEGGFVASPSFREATAGLPARSNSLFFFSFPRFMKALLDTAAKISPEEKAPPPWPLEEGRGSGIGVTYHSTGKALRAETHLPRREAENIRAVSRYLQSLDMKEGGPVPGNWF